MYVSFITDDHLLECISKLYDVYETCTQEATLSDFYRNKVDPIKFTFDTVFNNIDLEDYIVNEIARKKDKTINNAIGDFHQNLFDGIEDFEAPQFSGYDIRKKDNTIFAELKNKHNTMNSSSKSETYRKLKGYVDGYPNSTSYLVEVIAITSQNIPWYVDGYSNDNIRKISIDKFYEIATGDWSAFKNLCIALPIAIRDFLDIKGIEPQQVSTNNTVYETLNTEAASNNVDVLTQIFNDTFSTYNNFPIRN